ncbi:MAG: TetR family transcriptional regulator [Candidatus Dormibacteraeota bacterium]|jgi:AcrR family transcriptional regulator|nr:TetR family transcriptional regulator [Candidatus Dormibacteraeota bacterium]
MTVPVGISERKRRAVRAELSEVALQLLTDRDFESVTVDEIAAAAGVSRRTFFRYFASKEDVVFAFLDQGARRLFEEIVARPPEEAPVTAVHHALRQHMAAYQSSTALVRLVRETPCLRAREHVNREQLRLGIVEALARRLGVNAEQDTRPHVLASIALAPLDAAFVTWFSGARSGEDLGDLLDEALATFRRELELICSD